MPVSGSDILLCEKKDKVVTLTINRPERSNAISLELAERLEKAWAQFREDEDSWVCILTGVGEKAFCSGWDLLDQAEGNRKGLGLPKNMPQYWPYEIWKPIICAINGYAIAGGFQLAQDCDVRIASETAEFGIAETRWNMPAWWVCDILMSA